MHANVTGAPGRLRVWRGLQGLVDFQQSWAADGITHGAEGRHVKGQWRVSHRRRAVRRSRVRTGCDAFGGAPGRTCGSVAHRAEPRLARLFEGEELNSRGDPGGRVRRNSRYSRVNEHSRAAAGPSAEKLAIAGVGGQARRPGVGGCAVLTGIRPRARPLTTTPPRAGVLRDRLYLADKKLAPPQDREGASSANYVSCTSGSPSRCWTPTGCSAQP